MERIRGMNMVVWSKEQMVKRKQIMEEQHPGYMAMNTRMSVFLGVVLMARFLISGLSAVLSPGLVPILISAFGILMCFLFYRILLQNTWKLAYFFLLFRFMEILNTFPTMPSILVLNIYGVLIYIVTVLVMAVDCSFLLYIIASKKVHDMVEHNVLVHSGKDLSLNKVVSMYALESDDDEESGVL